MTDGAGPIDTDALLEHAEGVRRLARALLRDDAEASDLSQDVLATAMRHPPHSGIVPAQWLAGIARNLARLRRRTEARRRRREEEAPAAEEVPSPEALVERAQTHQLLTRLVLEIDEPFRATLLLRYYEGLSSAEIARRLEAPAGTVRWRLKRGLDALRARLDAETRDEPRAWQALLVPLGHFPRPSMILQGVLVMKATKILLALAVVMFVAWWGVRSYRGRHASDAATKPPGSPSARHRGVENRVALAMREAALPREPDPTGELRLEGQVIDDQDLPVAGAEIALDANPPRFLRSGGDGAFLFEKLIARDYRIEARAGAGHAGPTELRLTPSSEPVILRIRRGGALDVEVREALSGAPVAGASVELRSALTWQARTDERGHAQLSGIGAGWPTLHVAASGYAPTAILLRTSGDPQRAQRQIVSLTHGAAVAGRVIDGEGRPIAGARVVAVATAEPFPVVDVTRDGVVSGQDGSWRIQAVAAGTFRFIAIHPEFAPGSTPPMTLDGEHPQSDIVIRAGAGTLVSGKVMSDGGAPIASALVRLVGRGSVSWRLTREAYTDGAGRFLLRGLPERLVDVSASSLEGSSDLVRLDLAGGGERTVALTISIRGGLEGMVVAPSGQAIAEARVLVEPEWSGALGEREAWEARGVASTLADGGGRFRFGGLPAGRYQVRAVRPGGSDDILWSAKGTGASAGDRNVRIVVPADGRVRGRVAFKDGSTPEVFTVEVGAVRPEPFSPAQGEFELEAPGGKHEVLIAGPNFQQARIDDVHVKESETTDLGTITVEKGRSIGGRVLDGNGQPVPGAEIAGGLLLTGNGSALNIKEEGFRVQETESDAEGHYLLRGFGEHPIVVVAERAGQGRSSSVRIPRGPSSVELDLVLQPTGSLAGKVTRNGQPLPETVVIANPRGAKSSNFFVLTGADGSYTFDMLSAGEYVVFPVVGGGGIKPKDMFFKGVTVTAGSRTQADLVARYGSASVTINVLTDKGEAVGIAQLLVVAGNVMAPNLESLQEGTWLPTDGQVIPVYSRMAIGGAAARIDGLLPGPYSFCAVPLPVDPNDPVAMRAIRDQTGSLPMKCVTSNVQETGEKPVEIRVPSSATARK